MSSACAEMLKAARGYTTVGLIIHPLRKPKQGDKNTGKAPFEGGWQNRTEPRREEELMSFWGRETSNPFNIGLQCGKRSGITVMDIDDENPAIMNELFEGMSKDNLAISRRTTGRGHIYFKYTDKLQAVKKHFIDIEILNNGSNAVLPPSVHYSGSSYRMNREINSIDDFPEMPDELISRIKELFSTSDKLEAALNRCRKCIREKFTELKDEKDTKFYHTSTGRDFTLALMIELHANGAGEEELLLACKIIFRGDYTLDKSKKELNYVLDYAKDGGKPWTCETIQSKCNVITIGMDGNSICETCKPRGEEYKKNTGKQLSERARELLKLAFNKMLVCDCDKSQLKNGEGFNKLDSEAVHTDMDGKKDVSDEILIKHAYRLKKYKKQLARFGVNKDELEDVINGCNKRSKASGSEKIDVFFDEVADRILESEHIFSMRDTAQIYIYTDGVYRSEGAEAILDTHVRDAYNEIYKEKWEEGNPGIALPDHIPKATTRYVNEVIAYIRAYTHIPRKIIDESQDKYINFKNCIFNLDKWEFEEHTPDIKTICQIPVRYDEKAKCPQITNFTQDVAKPEDIPFLEEWAGYCLTTDVSYQKALMLYGIPGTGKSVYATMLETFIGEENASAESLQKIEEDKYRSAKLYGKRVNICSDIPSTKMHKTEVFKKLVSGLDTIDGENKFKDPFKFKNKAKLTFSANKIPEGPKDPAFYERFCLVEFKHKFRGTKDDDKKLIRKLTTDDELSGFLNVALKGLKRLYDNDKFSYNKTFEETEKEYQLNSNPVAYFMEECTMISDQDLDSTVLYLKYAEWCNINKKQRVTNIEFSRRLKQEGYVNHRENVRSDGSKKVTVWDNLQLKLTEKTDNQHEPEEKKFDFGQDLGQDQLDRSCPKFSSQPITESSLKTAFGQDLNPIVGFGKKMIQYNCENIDTVRGVKNEEIKNTPNMSKRSCPSVCFFDSEEYGQDVSKHPVLDPVREQKTLNFEQNEEENSMKILSGCDLMRTDLKNFARSKYHLTVDNIPVFVGEFNNVFPGYKQTYGLQAILDNAERLSSRGWR